MGMTLEEYMAKNPEKKKEPQTQEDVQRLEAEERKHRMAAISWEARRRGTSYGKLVGTLTLLEKEKIYKSFEEYQAAREAEMDAEPRITIEKPKRPGTQTITERRFDPSLTNSTENTEVTETLGK